MCVHVYMHCVCMCVLWLNSSMACDSGILCQGAHTCTHSKIVNVKPVVKTHVQYYDHTMVSSLKNDVKAKK